MYYYAIDRFLLKYNIILRLLIYFILNNENHYIFV